MNIRSLSHYVNSFLAFSLIKLSSLFKVSYVFGSHAAFFSLSNCSLPLTGRYFGFTGISIITIASMITRLIWGGITPLSLLVYHVPGFCAGLYWAAPHIATRLLLPIAMFLAFIIHPIGSQSFLYASLWLVPMAVYAARLQHIFAHALASTLIAHAVGSVIWIYAVPTTALFWNSLLPVALVERLTFAVGMMVLAYAVDQLRMRLQKPVVKVITTQSC